MKQYSKIAGIALIIFVVCFFAGFALEGNRETLGFQDADNPGVMMSYLKSRSDLFIFSGLLNVLMGFSLSITTLYLYESIQKKENLMLFRFGSLFALFASMYFFANGILRVQAPGTLLHMGNINSDWGEAGYLAVQMAGTQGLASAGGFAISLWVLSTSLFNFRTKIFWNGLSWLGMATVGMLLGAFIGPFLPNTDIVYPIYILGIFMTYIWCLLFGINLLTKATK